MSKELPSGYNWRLHSYADDEGIVITVTLVASSYKPGSWRDKFFGREVLSSACEVDLEAEQEELDEKTDQLRAKVASHFFAGNNWH